jgi:hypothetical protein
MGMSACYHAIPRKRDAERGKQWLREVFGIQMLTHEDSFQVMKDLFEDDIPGLLRINPWMYHVLRIYDTLWEEGKW